MPTTLDISVLYPIDFSTSYGYIPMNFPGSITLRRGPWAPAGGPGIRQSVRAIPASDASAVADASGSTPGGLGRTWGCESAWAPE